MNKFLLYLFFLLITSSCGIGNKEIEKSDNLKTIFEKTKPIKKELNPGLKVKLNKLKKGEVFIGNNTNNLGNVNFQTNFKRGGFFPPIELQRRIFAGEQINYHNPLLVGLPATRTGTITRLDEKKRKNGRMVLVTATYIIEQEGKK